MRLYLLNISPVCGFGPGWLEVGGNAQERIQISQGSRSWYFSIPVELWWSYYVQLRWHTKSPLRVTMFWWATLTHWSVCFSETHQDLWVKASRLPHYPKSLQKTFLRQGSFTWIAFGNHTNPASGGVGASLSEISRSISHDTTPMRFSLK